MFTTRFIPTTVILRLWWAMKEEFVDVVDVVKVVHGKRDRISFRRVRNLFAFSSRFEFMNESLWQMSCVRAPHGCNSS